MQNAYKLLGLGCVALGLMACQSTPREYNGATGYQVENQTENTATISYTLSAIRTDQRIDEKKLQRTCQKVLNSQKTYKLTILSANQIANPNTAQPENQGVRLGQSRTSFGLSNTQSINSSEDIATHEALNSRPSTLAVVRYTCT